VLVEGQEETGVSLHYMVAKPDAGDLVDQERVAIDLADTAFTLYGKLEAAAGRLLDRALDDAGIDRSAAYVTNAVKHFRFTGSAGKRRIHQKPDMEHVRACRPWLEAELGLLAPEVVVLLGATAASALIGPSFRVTKQRGQLLPWDGPSGGEDAGVHAGWMLATIHPSAVLRTQGDDRDAAYDGLVSDLKVAAGALAS
ncbi:MAG: uracil-DNA glycosylase family protein, partial [Mycobacteriales bacterium]